jgi:ssDNA-binding Zn-finger/Zn-ribbon topoisomerase 1
MPFQLTPRATSTFKKLDYFFQEPGKHYIRFIEPTEKASILPSHYFPRGQTGISLQCLGEDCPACKNNRRLWLENPGKKWKDIEGLISLSDRIAINILDRTMVKVCPKTECQAEVKAGFTGRFPDTCPYCNSILNQAAIKESGKVKVLSIPPTIADLISQLEAAQLDEAGNPVPVTRYDFELLVMQKGKKKEMTPQVARERCDVIIVPEEAYFDTSRAVIRLELAEMEDFLRGASLKDIFAKKSAEKTMEVAESDAAVPADIVDRVNSILAD